MSTASATALKCWNRPSCALGGGDADIDHPLVLFHGERGRFAGGAAGHQPVRAFLDLPGHELLEAFLIDRSVLERGDQRDK
jgi:hypothetical protein